MRLLRMKRSQKSSRQQTQTEQERKEDIGQRGGKILADKEPGMVCRKQLELQLICNL